MIYNKNYYNRPIIIVTFTYKFHTPSLTTITGGLK